MKITKNIEIIGKSLIFEEEKIPEIFAADIYYITSSPKETKKIFFHLLIDKRNFKRDKLIEELKSNGFEILMSRRKIISSSEKKDPKIEKRKTSGKGRVQKKK